MNRVMAVKIKEGKDEIGPEIRSCYCLHKW